jgi:phenylalanyl-tRNA synthetase alpha subunit
MAKARNENEREPSEKVERRPIINEMKKKLTDSSDSVTSPTFNSMAVVSTSTPSSMNQQQQATNEQIENKSSKTSSDFNKAVVKKKDFSSQVSRDDLNGGENKNILKIVQYVPNRNATSDMTRMSAIDELDRCIAEFDRSDQSMDKSYRDDESKSYINNKSLTFVSDLSKSSFRDDPGSASGNIRILTRLDHDNENKQAMSHSAVELSPDFNNNNSVMDNGNSRVAPFQDKGSNQMGMTPSPPQAPPIPKNFNTMHEKSPDFKSFILKSVTK